MGRATRIRLPDDIQEVRTALDAAASKLDALRELGVHAPELASSVEAGRAALAVEDLSGAQARADEVRIVVKLAATEIEKMLNHGGEPWEETEPLSSSTTAPARDLAPEADLPAQVEAVVKDTFHKALYGNALRQMVEIVAAERLREFLQDAEMMGTLIDDRVRAAMRSALEAEAAGSPS